MFFEVDESGVNIALGEGWVWEVGWFGRVWGLAAGPRMRCGGIDGLLPTSHRSDMVRLLDSMWGETGSRFFNTVDGRIATPPLPAPFWSFRHVLQPKALKWLL